MRRGFIYALVAGDRWPPSPSRAARLRRQQATTTPTPVDTRVPVTRIVPAAGPVVRHRRDRAPVGRRRPDRAHPGPVHPHGPRPGRSGKGTIENALVDGKRTDHLLGRRHAAAPQRRRRASTSSGAAVEVDAVGRHVDHLRRARGCCPATYRAGRAGGGRRRRPGHAPRLGVLHRRRPHRPQHHGRGGRSSVDPQRLEVTGPGRVNAPGHAHRHRHRRHPPGRGPSTSPPAPTRSSSPPGLQARPRRHPPGPAAA